MRRYLRGKNHRKKKTVMIQIKVFTKEDTENGYDGTLLTHLKPRSYMCGYSFEQLLKYAREELYWADIKEEEITGFEIFNKREHWVQYIGKEYNNVIVELNDK